ncbi:MAG TPA: TonB-dependent receptor [Thermoanaerobaculia bacterium]|jgi:outer membrane receptor protein involved in Fe transport|nr:TonB-dependent receptor [Thermoanaerobaculia bacterium]
MTRTIAASMLLLIAATLHAQPAITSAAVAGTVRDAAGAPIAGANVVASNFERNQKQKTVTDAAGRFRFPVLAVGSYAILIERTGFMSWIGNLRLAVGASVNIPVTLQMAHSETIDVSGALPTIDTARTEIASNVSPEEVRTLPLNGRNYLDLALLAPGVSRTNTGANQRFAETSAVPGTGISVSTQRNLANSFVVDGLSANDDAAELAGTFFSQEVIREFEVIRSVGSAEFGRASAGIVNIVTQSGTSTLRGDAYGFFRNDRFDAANALSHSKLPLRQNQSGVTLGGPLIRDRAFFFANAEGMRQRTVGIITIAPASVTAINARLDAVAYAGPRISTGNFDTTLDTTNLFARIDDMVTPSDELTARLNTYDVTSDNSRSVGGLNAVSRGTGLANHDRTLAANNLWTISTDAISETRAQMTRSRLAAPPNDLTGPAVNIGGIASFGTLTVSPTARDIDLAEAVQNVTWLRGNHSVKTGVDLLRNRVRIAFPGALQGVYTFSSLANFLTGNYAGFQQAFGEPETHQNNDNIGAFVQDEWHATPRLVIDAGLRYDVQQLPRLVHTDRNNISPRIGAAWDIRGDGRSVLRGAAGLYYDPIPLRAVSNALQRNGVTYRVAQVGPATPGAPVFPNVLPSFPAGLQTNITTIDRDIEDSSSTQATLQYERQIGAASSASIGIEHLRGRNIIMSRKISATNTQFQSIGDSWYDGLTIAVAKRPVSWGSVRLSYTFSKGLDTSGNFFFSQPQDANDIAAERGRSDNDQRHRLTLSGTLTMPAHWMLSYIAAYASTLPFNIQLPNDRNGNGVFNDRPTGVGRNTGHGFDYQTLDLRLSRAFPITGRVSIETIVDAFNVLNRANYQVPNNIITSPTFGRPTAVNDPRQLQLGLRLLF